MKKAYPIAGLVVIVLGVLIYMFNMEEDAPDRSAGQDVKTQVEAYSSGRIQGPTASITSQQLIVTEDGRKSTFDLPENEFFVSIAPYLNNTHPCATHSLTSCSGEMVGEEFDVYIEDTDGNMIVDQKLKSQTNGFIDLWLPREKKYRITIKYAEKLAEMEFSTFDSDDTCISTMKLT